MISRLLIVGLTAGLVSACSSRVDQPMVASPVRSAQAPQQDYVWARNDGQRMAGNPALYAKGQADQNRCRSSSTMGGALDQETFVRCMEAAGYTPRAG